MNSIFNMARTRVVVGLLALTVGALAAMPGSFGSALAQTAPGTTTTGQGTSVTVTNRDGSTTTTVTTTGGTVVAINTPATGGFPTVTITPAPNANITAPIETISATIGMAAGTLGADEVISIVAGLVGEFTGFSSAVNMVPEHGASVVNFAAAPGSLRAVKVFEMTVKTKTGATSNIQKPVTMTWDFSPADLAEAGGDFSNLKMFSRDETTKAWSIEAKQVGKTATSVTFEVPHFSLWAFVVRTPGPATTPTGPAQAATPAGTGAAIPPGAVAPRPANTGTGIPAEQSAMTSVLPYALAVLGLGLLGGIAMRTARRRS